MNCFITSRFKLRGSGWSLIIFFVNAVILILSGCSGTSPEVSVAKPPNVILILSDDQGWGDAGFNGASEVITPHLDQLAAEGVVFSQGYASHPYCSPSRAGLLTGRYQQRFGHECNIINGSGLEDHTLGLPLDQTLLAELFKENGYATCAIGKWHLGESREFWPINRGFDYWFGFLGGDLSYWGDTEEMPESMGILRNGEVVKKDEISYLTDDFSRVAEEYIQENRGKPFFMYLAYNAPHGPYQATREYLEITDYIENSKRAVYSAMVRGMDEGISRITDKLEELDLLENTLIVFLSDNGGMDYAADNSPYRGYKGMLFEGGIRVPFMIHWPAGLEGGQVYRSPVTALDVFPTVLSATGIEVPENLDLDGVNLMPYLTGMDPGIPHQKLYWRYSGGKGFAVRDGDYKLVMEAVREDTFLFDLKADPYEMHDLSEELPDKTTALLYEFDEWNSQNTRPAWDDPHIRNVIRTREKRLLDLKEASSGQR